MLGSLISAGSQLLGGLLGSNSADKANKAAAQQAELNRQMQLDFAQQGIRWKVADAKAAGIHPIYALGGSTHAYTPVSQNFVADTSLPNALAGAGQDIGRAINSTRTQSERMGAFSKTAQALQLENMSLQNDALRTEIASKTARLRSPAAPPFPGDNYLIPGQSESGGIKPTPLEVTPAPKSQPQSEPGSITDMGYARTRTGYAPVPSKDVKERIEDVPLQGLLHFLRNNVMPSIGMNMAPPPFKAPEGQEWHFHVPTQEYRLQPKGQGWWDRGFTVRHKGK